VKNSVRIGTFAICAIALAAFAAKQAVSTAPVNGSYLPCSLLTSAEVGAALGVPVLQVSHVPPDRCEYRGKGALETIFVEASQSGADAQFKGGEIADALMGLSRSSGAPKVGDDSYWEAMGNVLYARKGGAYVGIDMRAAAVKTRIIGPRLASLALSRMH
jgi:hypothetical protein